MRLSIADIAERMQVPAEFVAVPAMVAAGSLIGNKVGIRPMRHDDWHVVPNVWGCIIGRPGTMKSPAVQQAFGRLNTLQARPRAEHADAAEELMAGEQERAMRAEARKSKAISLLKKDSTASLAGLIGDEEEQ